MAKAPRPGAGKRQAVAGRAKVLLRITVKGESNELAPNNLTFEERTRVRKQTGGIPFENYWDGETSVGEDSVVVLWWLARRAGGETKLALNTVWREWQDLLDDGLTADDLEIVEITPDDDTADELDGGESPEG
jgi:hypothetical protein